MKGLLQFKSRIGRRKIINLFDLFERVLHDDYIQLQENAASYFVERRGETLYLFFEKSNGAEDWKNNFDFPAKPYREMRDLWFVHRGFLRVFKTIESKIAGDVADTSVKNIVVAGYSHGAAIALLCHEYCVFHRPDIAKNIYGFGFGCPRVVWGALNCRLRARFENFLVIRNCRDIVTHLPPAIFGFRHAGKLLHIGRHGHYGPIDSHRPEAYSTMLAEYQRRINK